MGFIFKEIYLTRYLYNSDVSVDSHHAEEENGHKHIDKRHRVIKGTYSTSENPFVCVPISYLTTHIQNLINKFVWPNHDL